MMIEEKGGTVEFRIRGLDEATHTAAKMLSARRRVSLNKFVLDAIHHECLRVAHADGVTDQVVRAIERKKPARS